MSEMFKIKLPDGSVREVKDAGRVEDETEGETENGVERACCTSLRD